MTVSVLGVQTSGPQTVPGSSPTLGHVCITTEVSCMAGTKKRVYEILASLDS